MSPPPPPVPRLRYRITGPEDVAECLSLLPGWLALPPALQAQLPALWGRLVLQPAMHSMVMEDLALPRGPRIQAWGSNLLITPADVRRLDLAPGHNPAPGLARRIYEDLLSGQQALHDDQTLGRHNARGDLQTVFLHFATRPLDWQQPYGQAVIAISNDSLRVGVCGYHLAALHFENHVSLAETMHAAGFLLRTPAAAVGADGLQRWGMTREEARRIMPGSTARAIFDAHPPRFRLSLSQRRLLWLSLFNEDEAVLQQALQLSPHGLKKLWRGVYERVQDAVPDFLGEASPQEDEGRRGPEKRRQVLAYVRQRPEELRPWAEGPRVDRSGA